MINRRTFVVLLVNTNSRRVAGVPSNFITMIDLVNIFPGGGFAKRLRYES